MTDKERLRAKLCEAITTAQGRLDKLLDGKQTEAAGIAAGIMATDLRLHKILDNSWSRSEAGAAAFEKMLLLSLILAAADSKLRNLDKGNNDDRATTT